MRVGMLLILPVWLLVCGCFHPGKPANDQTGQAHHSKVHANSLIPQINSFLLRKGQLKVGDQIDSVKILAGYLDDEDSLISAEESATYLLGLGDIAFAWDRFALADSCFERALRRYDQADPSPEQSASLYIRLAEVKLELRDLITSESYLDIAFDVVKNRLSSDEGKWGDCMGIIAGLHYYRHEYENAIAAWETALKHYERAGIYKPRYLANIAQAYERSGHYSKGVEYLNRAVGQARRKSKDPKVLADLYLLKGFFENKYGSGDSGLFYLRQMEVMRRQLYGEKGSYAFGASYTVGLYFNNANLPDSAAKRFHKSLTALVEGFESMDIKDNPRPRISECTTDLFLGLKEKGLALARLGESRPIPTEYYDAALNALLLADSVIHVCRRNSFYDDSQLELKGNYQAPYEKILDLSYSLYQTTRDVKYLNMSLRTMESSRAALVQDALKRLNNTGESVLPASLQQSERNLAQSRANLLMEMADASDEKRKSINERLRDINRDQWKLQQEIKRYNPNYNSIRYAEPVSDIGAIRKKLLESDTFLEYLWGDHSAYLLAIDQTSATLKRIARNAEFDSFSQTFIEEVGDGERDLTSIRRYERFTESAFYLYNKLLGEHLTGFPGNHLIISVDGRLSGYPFGAMIMEPVNSAEVNYKLEYVINRYVIAQVYSAGVLLSTRGRKVNEEKLLAFGYGHNAEAGLPGTEEELRSIGLSMHHPENEYLVNDDASEDRFKKTVGDYNIVHLALHGMADTTNALQSHLIFRKPQQEAAEDGLLYAHELYGLDLKNVELVVLSACESGLGKVQTGEGVMSIARGFIYSGCPSVLMSLWKVNDDATARLMKDFYRNLSAKSRIDDALAFAARAYINEASEFNAHPSKWAAFFSMGETSPVRPGQDIPIWAIILGGVCLAASGYAIVRPRRHKTLF